MAETELNPDKRFDDVAEKLEKSWVSYRNKVSNRLDFDTRVELSTLSFNLGKSVRDACAALRQAENDLADCEAQVARLRNSVGRMQAE